jgi:hypothetical protein
MLPLKVCFAFVQTGHDEFGTFLLRRGIPETLPSSEVSRGDDMCESFCPAILIVFALGQ